MYYKVRIKKMPKARTGYQVRGSLFNDVPAFGGADYNSYIGTPNLKESKYITAVPRDKANLEAEGGETVLGDINGDGFPEHKIIKGPRHSEGGVPLNLPDDSFIFSDTKSMKIKDPNILAMFNKPMKKSGYTPAELAKSYDLEKYRKILQDPDSDMIDRKTAELMLRNYNVKLAQLALAQEAKKGFPQGIPKVAEPAMQAMGLTPESVLPMDLNKLKGPQQEMPQEEAESPEYQEGEPQEQEMAEQMNQNQPVAMPMQEEQEMAWGGVPMAEYGMTIADYGMPFYDIPNAEYGMPMGITSRNYMGREPMYARGGISYDDAFELYKMDGGGKVYKESDLPEGTTVKSAKDPSIKVGDFVRDADGNIRKIKAGSLKQTVSSATLPGTRAEFINASPENKAIMDKGDAILDRAIREGKAYIKNGKLNLNGDLNLSFEDRIALSKALNASQEFGTGKYIIGTQHRNDPYSKMTSGKLAKGSFVAGFKPEDYEKRYLFEKARGLGNTEEEAFKIVSDVYSDNKKIAQLRREYLGAIGKKNLAEGKTDDQLLNNSFYKTNYAAVTEGIEQSLGESGYRPKMGNEGLSGFEHFDAAGYKPDFQYEQDNTCTCTDGTVKELVDGKCPCEEKEQEQPKDQKEQPCECTKADGTKVTSYYDESTGDCSQLPCQEAARPTDIPAPWWLQDTIKTAAIAGDLMGIKKYMPWAPDPSLVKPRPVFLDPTRELAAQSEQANIQTQALAQFAGPQALSARSSSVQGQAAKQAADTLSRYNNANVNIANQFEMKRADIDNQETLMKQASRQKLYDQNTIANQQFDNSKRAMRNALVNQYTNAITNRWQTHALNQMFPQFNVDPSVGGRGFYTGINKKITPGTGGRTYNDLLSYYKTDMGMTDADAINAADKAWKNQSANSNNDLAAYNAHFGKRKGKKGGESNHPGFLYGDVTFPFIL